MLSSPLQWNKHAGVWGITARDMHGCQGRCSPPFSSRFLKCAVFPYSTLCHTDAAHGNFGDVCSRPIRMLRWGAGHRAWRGRSRAQPTPPPADPSSSSVPTPRLAPCCAPTRSSSAASPRSGPSSPENEDARMHATPVFCCALRNTCDVS